MSIWKESISFNVYYSKYEPIKEEVNSQEILDMAQKAADEASDRLTQKKPVSAVSWELFIIHASF